MAFSYKEVRLIVEAERHVCAWICMNHVLSLEEHKYPTVEERTLIAIVEAGCRNAFYEAIMARNEKIISNVKS